MAEQEGAIIRDTNSCGGVFLDREPCVCLLMLRAGARRCAPLYEHTPSRCLRKLLCGPADTECIVLLCPGEAILIGTRKPLLIKPP